MDMDMEQLKKDVEALKRGQEEILTLLREQGTRGAVSLQDQISEFRAMVRQGADPVQALKAIQRDTRRDTVHRVRIRKGGKV